MAISLKQAPACGRLRFVRPRVCNLATPWPPAVDEWKRRRGSSRKTSASGQPRVRSHTMSGHFPSNTGVGSGSTAQTPPKRFDALPASKRDVDARPTTAEHKYANKFSRLNFGADPNIHILAMVPRPRLRAGNSALAGDPPAAGVSANSPLSRLIASLRQTRASHAHACRRRQLRCYGPPAAAPWEI
jgi:hypothetical protein